MVPFQQYDVTLTGRPSQSVFNCPLPRVATSFGHQVVFTSLRYWPICAALKKATWLLNWRELTSTPAALPGVAESAPGTALVRVEVRYAHPSGPVRSPPQ